MFELLVLIAFIWLFAKAIALAFRVTWGLAKVAAVVMFTLALPALIGCLLLASGAVLLIPVALVGAAWGILRSCV